MSTSMSRLSLNASLEFDVLDTARLLEYQLREIESLCQEAKFMRDNNRTRRKQLAKELAALNDELQQETVATQKLAAKLQVVVVGATWFPERALVDVLNSQASPVHHTFHSAFSESAWQHFKYHNTPPMQPASAFIQSTEPYNDSYVFGDSRSCTSPLAYDAIHDLHFIESPHAQQYSFLPSALERPQHFVQPADYPHSPSDQMQSHTFGSEESSAGSAETESLHIWPPAMVEWNDEQGYAIDAQ